jgi:hypothetical protein
MSNLLRSVAICALLGAGSAAHASDLWVSTQTGLIGEINAVTGATIQEFSTGLALTDIGFIGNQMYGTTSSSLYSIDDMSGASTLIGSYSGGISANALVGYGSILLGAASNSDKVYQVNPTNAALGLFATSPLTSAGDLAFSGGTLYESAANTDGYDALVNVSTNSIVGDFHFGAGTFNMVLGLADDGTKMYAFNGNNVYDVNLSNADLTFLFTEGVGIVNGIFTPASGAAFTNENLAGAVPELKTWGMIILGFGGMGLLGYKKSKLTKTAALRTSSMR